METEQADMTPAGRRGSMIVWECSLVFRGMGAVGSAWVNQPTLRSLSSLLPSVAPNVARSHA